MVQAAAFGYGFTVQQVRGGPRLVFTIQLEHRDVIDTFFHRVRTLEDGNVQCVWSFDNRTKFVKVQFYPEKSPFIASFISKNAGGK
jgi:hypothetical protein